MLHMFEESGTVDGYATPFRAYEAIENMPYILSTTGDDMVVLTLINNNVFRNDVIFQILFVGKSTVTITDIEQFDDLVHINIPLRFVKAVDESDHVRVVYANPQDADDIDYFEWNGFSDDDCECIILANYAL